MNHIWTDGPHGERYHCKRCGISKVNDYDLFDTCESWREEKIRRYIVGSKLAYKSTISVEIVSITGNGIATKKEVIDFVESHPESVWLEGASNSVLSNIYRGRLSQLIKKDGRYYSRIFFNIGNFAQKLEQPRCEYCKHQRREHNGGRGLCHAGGHCFCSRFKASKPVKVR